MLKLIAILNVIAWAGFWAFGSLAPTTKQGGGMVAAVLLAAIGGVVGLHACFRLIRHSGATRYSGAGSPRFAADEGLGA